MAGPQLAAWCLPIRALGSATPTDKSIRTQVDSFFNFFSPPEIPTDEVDDDEMAELQETLEGDYELGCAVV